MKHVLIAAFMLLTIVVNAQMEVLPYSPTKIGDFVIQSGKIYYLKTIGVSYKPETYSAQLKKRDSANQSIKVNKTTDQGLKGTFVAFPLDWTSPGFKKKKIDGFLCMPFNATFEIKRQDQGYQLKVTNIWFNDNSKSSGKINLTLEDIVTKGGITFSKNKNHVRALSILNMNLDEVFLPVDGF